MQLVIDREYLLIKAKKLGFIFNKRCFWSAIAANDQVSASKKALLVRDWKREKLSEFAMNCLYTNSCHCNRTFIFNCSV